MLHILILWGLLYCLIAQILQWLLRKCLLPFYSNISCVSLEWQCNDDVLSGTVHWGDETVTPDTFRVASLQSELTGHLKPTKCSPSASTVIYSCAYLELSVPLNDFHFKIENSIVKMQVTLPADHIIWLFSFGTGEEVNVEIQRSGYCNT